ncbi:phosphoenolpyruvate--protein phosphotransferase [Azospirillum sp. SYSU D00513]|uniref:phosphoenolpyruvate--protein phosphotransferase n=1 Tax=Azospirillum sp. SYSU D00513 TaxID=2812561 RepID=UPI001A966558|nr:phosphoenolpyruvate--protein phosphotransferase [Azospirillum sp. SYSU D00513]
MSMVTLGAPISGWAAPLSEVPDPAFAEGMIGEGIAIDPTDATLRAPCDGTVLSVHRARHACTVQAANGAEILMHIGVDTVALNGEGFTVHVGGGQAVRAGDPLISFDMDLLAARARSLMTMLIVVNGDEHAVGDLVTDREVAAGEPVMSVTARTGGGDGGETAGARSAERQVVLPIAHGLHARPAAALAAAAKAHAGAVTIACGGRNANAKSVTALMALGSAHGDRMTLTVEGDGADAAADRIAGLIAAGLGDPVLPVTAVPGTGVATTSTEAPFTEGEPVLLKATVAVPGLAVGRAVRLVRKAAEVPEQGAGPEMERRRLKAAIAATADRIEAAATQEIGGHGAIFAAHRALLEDPELNGAAMAAIAEGRSAEWAWRTALSQQAETLAGLADPRMAERAADLRDLEAQVLAALGGHDTLRQIAGLPEGSVLIAGEIMPSEVTAAPPGRLAGIVMEEGGPTSHAAILAASLGIPTLVAAGRPAARVPDGAPLIVDGNRGELRVFPPFELVRATLDRIESGRARRAANLAAAGEDCRMADGTRIELFANLGRVADAASAVVNGAEGCGLLRTEFLFLDRGQAPTEEEQRDQYQSVADALGTRPLIVRTLDVGGDKPLPYLPLPREENPVLGLRGVRVGLRDPELLRAQIRAILRVRPAGRCRVMVPMVTSVSEIEAVRRMVEEERAALGIAVPVEVGAMIEVPAAALMADRLSRVADFLSIGTNDLTQYVLAMDRGNPHVAAQLDTLHPGVLRLIAQVTKGAAAFGRPVAVCGGSASDPVAAPLLIGLGVTELSATPAVIPDLKAFIRTLRPEECRTVAEAALNLDSAEEVRRLVAERWSGF